MKFLEEYRDPAAARKLQLAIREVATKSWTIMEVCGGQTHTIIKYGLEELLPPGVQLVHGPGCPVCVTPLEMIDKAIRLASRNDVIFCSFGDMIRVPGSQRPSTGSGQAVFDPEAQTRREHIEARDLSAIKASGGDVRIVYSPLDSVQIARENPDKSVVFFAVGFETTAPANAMAVWQAKRRGIENFCLLVSHVLVPPAMTAILSSPGNRVQGFLAAGHVCAVMGYEEYIPLARRFGVPIVVTGFEPLDLLEGIYRCLCMLEAGQAGVQNQYSRAVTSAGNLPAQRLIKEVFEITDRAWRGIGVIPRSGLRLSSSYARFDAERRLDLSDVKAEEPPICISGQILQGMKKPRECPAFGRQCTPRTPLGATMVSGEGACAAYYHYSPPTECRACQLPAGGQALCKRA